MKLEHALRDNPDTPAVPPQKMHCSVMAYDVIKKAAATYKGVDMESFETEEIICECARVSLGTIQEVIKINNLTTIEQITDYTKAGAFCKSCVKPGGHEEKEIYLVDILENSLNNNEVETNNTSHFNDLTTVQQIREIESILDRDIRPMLAMDGGNIELIDIKQNNGKNIIYVRYLGACSGCSSGDLTLGFIEEKLKQELQEDNLELIYT
jgi:NifU-like protein